MCGIHLIIDKRRTLDDSYIQKMLLQSTHRGPDDSNFLKFHSPHSCFIGVNRLRITDLSAAGAQPMQSDGYILAFNGEIYNYPEIKNELLNSGCSFSSSSDTEVLFQMLRRGDSLFSLNGMYTYIFSDSESQSILLERDSRGMKPLYYYEDDNYFIASSEIKAILSTGLVTKDLNEQAVQQYLQFKYVSPPATFYKGIKEVLPGEQLKICESTVTSKIIKRSQPDNTNGDGIVQHTGKLLEDAILNHLPDNQSSALFLSGGMDSTLLLAIMQKLGYMVPSYSFISSKKDQNYGTEDAKFAKRAARQYGSEHHLLETDKASVFNRLNEYISKIDQPIGDSAGIMTWLLSKEIGQSHKIALSGAGADELFGGYNRHAAFYTYLKKYKLLNASKQAGRLTGAFLEKNGFESGRLLRRLMENIHRDPSQTFAGFSQLLADSSAPPKLWQDSSTDRLEHHLAKALWYDQTKYLVSDVLAINDTMGMQSSVEIRSPYLDSNLVDWCAAIPSTTKMERGKKWILAKLLEDYDGQSYSKRHKQGFGLPFKGWIDKQNEKLWSFDHSNFILYKFVPQERIQQLLKHHIDGKRNYSSELWALLVLGKWLDLEFYS